VPSSSDAKVPQVSQIPPLAHVLLLRTEQLDQRGHFAPREIVNGVTQGGQVNQSDRIGMLAVRTDPARYDLAQLRTQGPVPADGDIA
jgi:hypothetical protein